MADDRSLFERDYATLRTLAKATVLAVLLPKGFITRSLEGVVILAVLVLAWGAFTGPATPPPVSMVRVKPGEDTPGIRYHVGSATTDGAHTIAFTNDLDLEVRDILFACDSEFAGPYELFVEDPVAPHSEITARRDGITTYPSSCRLKAYETYTP